jgi:hypothetical protein
MAGEPLWLGKIRERGEEFEKLKIVNCAPITIVRTNSKLFFSVFLRLNGLYFSE